MITSAFSQVGQIASQRSVHAALAWLHLHEQQIMRWQLECVAIPAPPFAESARAAWIAARFEALGLADVHQDEAGNVLGVLNPAPPIADPAALPGQPPVILLSAHMDTVFPGHTPLDPVLTGTRLRAPGACDNGAGLAALFAVAAALRHAAIAPRCRIVFLGNVGEEGEGDLRGIRHIYAQPHWRANIAAHLVLDGAGQTIAVTEALGSRRFEVLVTGAGGHSWTDAARPNPIVALSEAITRLRSKQTSLSSSAEPAAKTNGHKGRDHARPKTRTTWSIGTIEGGSSVNAIPATATGRFDLRSTDAAELLHLEVELHRAVEDAVIAANRGCPAEHTLRFSIRNIGDRPAGALPEDARILLLLRAVDRHLGLRTELRTASTDANIPLALGVEAISLGAGGAGGGIHTTAEWFDGRGRDVGLRRILLLVLALANCDADSPHEPDEPGHLDHLDEPDEDQLSNHNPGHAVENTPTDSLPQDPAAEL
ncbi:M20/M25/M40 family metallo-hydrolase [Acidipila sp. EB88]|nr:M20/M25/M40 family metallo-hydrolase [Acidipila sp. EB88]RRA49519.1 M20/M25/M40 family metallo-hydrolase [Acidipila sp. EB88]